MIKEDIEKQLIEIENLADNHWCEARHYFQIPFLLDTIRYLLKDRDWQPIETAPKDGTRFLALLKPPYDDKLCPAVCVYMTKEKHDWLKAGDGKDGFYNIWAGRDQPETNIFYWMPLPAIPSFK